jgi:hypothetical protein
LGVAIVSTGIDAAGVGDGDIAEVAADPGGTPQPASVASIIPLMPAATPIRDRFA